MSASPTPVGHVIPRGASIPDDVLRVEDKDVDPWQRTDAGWSLIGAADDTYLVQRADLVSDAFGPLTVTAVREPDPLPASMLRKTDVDLSDDEPVHYYVSEFSRGQTFCGLGLEEDLQTTSEAGGATCTACLTANDEAPRPEPAGELPRHIAAILDDLKPGAPLVLSLPSVPDGTVALIGASGKRYELRDGWWSFDDGDTTWIGNFVALLADDGPVSVVMREPRTWPRLDGAPADLNAVRGRSGTVYVLAVRRELGTTTFIDKAYVEGGGVTHTLSDLQEWDGPLTEVFDEPGGQP